MKLEVAEQLWNSLPHPSPEHVVRLFGRAADSTVIGDFACEPNDIVRFADACSGTYNCYVCPNPTLRRHGVRHNSTDVTHWSYLLIDIDPVEENPSPDEALIEVLARLSGLFGKDIFNKNTPTIIFSGRGFQIWLRGEDIVLGQDFPHDKARKIMSYWLTNMLSNRLGTMHGCKIDTSTSDLPRPMRMPGTINLKTGFTSSFLEIQKRPYPWLFPTLIHGTPPSVFEVPEIKVIAGLSWQMVFPHLSLSAKEFLMHGKEEPGRHKVMFHTAKSLFELGVPRDKAREGIARANGLKGKDNALSPSDIEHSLDSAYGQESA